jgi:hypothetical protein
VPRVIVRAESGEVFWDESVRAADFDGEHFRRCLADRLAWAVADAEGGSSGDLCALVRDDGALTGGENVLLSAA